MKLILALLLAVFCSNVFAQKERETMVPSSKVFEGMDKQVEKLGNDLRKTEAAKATRPEPAASTELTASFTLLVQQTDKNVEALNKIAVNRPISKEYKASIDESADDLKAIRKKGRYTPADLALVDDINEDLKVKLQHAQIRSGAPFDSIKINVHTKKNGTETGEYQVWWVKFAYRNDASKYQTFDKFSSPASRLLPPGKYVMWTTTTDGKKTPGEKTPKEFGDGSAEIDTDLIAP